MNYKPSKYEGKIMFIGGDSIIITENDIREITSQFNKEYHPDVIIVYKTLEDYLLNTLGQFVKGTGSMGRTVRYENGMKVVSLYLFNFHVFDTLCKSGTRFWELYYTIVLTLIHELRHVFQFNTYNDTTNIPRLEKDANKFSYKKMGQYRDYLAGLYNARWTDDEFRKKIDMLEVF